MRIIALDIGEKRVGIATCDAGGKLAFPVDVLSADEVLNVSRSFKRILEDYEPELLVVGLPFSLSGEENAQAQRVRGIAGALADKVCLPLEYIDERLSSSEAKRILREQGIDARQARGKVDKIAAALFLQAYLDKKSN